MSAVLTAPAAGGRGVPAGRTTGSADDLVTGHLAQLDLLRLLTFAAVIAVHSVAFTQTDSSTVAGGLLMPLQFTREVFFALTAVVLTWSARDRPVRWRAFTRRRVGLVLVPLLCWTAIYYGWHLAIYPGPWRQAVNWHDIWSNELLAANAEYHLYFLLVTIQLYLVFPLLLRVLRATADRWWAVLGPVVVANLGWLAVLAYVPAPGGWVGEVFWVHAYELLPTYAACAVGGGYAALHLPRITAAIVDAPRRVLAVAGLGVAAALVVYVAQLHVGWVPRRADEVLQPVMAGPSVAAALVLYLAGCRWVRAGRPAERIVEVGSEISFGVYLAHPLILEVLLRAGLHSAPGQAVPAWLAPVPAYLGAAAGATLIALLARRTMLSLPLTGRPRRARR